MKTTLFKKGFQHFYLFSIITCDVGTMCNLRTWNQAKASLCANNNYFCFTSPAWEGCFSKYKLDFTKIVPLLGYVLLRCYISNVCLFVYRYLAQLSDTSYSMSIALKRQVYNKPWYSFILLLQRKCQYRRSKFPEYLYPLEFCSVESCSVKE